MLEQFGIASMQSTALHKFACGPGVCVGVCVPGYEKTELAKYLCNFCNRVYEMNITNVFYVNAVGS